MKIHTIYNSDTYENYTDDDIIQSILDCYPEREGDVTDDEIYEQRIELSQWNYDDARLNLNKLLPNKILIIADLGLWSGRYSGYKEINNNNLNSILNQAQGEYYHVYYDGYNIKANDTHHDGTNHYLFRLIKDNVNIDNLLEKLYNGTATRNDINKYTKSLRPYIKEIYGWN